MSDTEKPTETAAEPVSETIESKPVSEKELEKEPVTEDTTEPDTVKETTPATETTSAPSTEAAPPPRPPRPLSPKALAKKTLKDAFPDVDDKYITMVLIASRGEMDPAFSALLYLNDPTVEQELVIPAVVPKPKLPSRNKQLESDEALARRLAREYERQSGRGGSRRSSANPHSGTGAAGRRRYQEGPDGEDDDVLDRFIEKDLPQIKEQFNKNVEEARAKLGGWIGGFKQRINSQTDGSNELFSAFGTGSGNSNKSNDNISYNRDRREDEAVQGVHGITLKDNDLPEKTLPNPPEDIYGTPTTPKAKEPVETKTKWEPLKTVQPDPVSNDTFLVTDSEEDEDEVKK
ncbi:unnamed protein product [Kuraishia capsulata CBS 1993]|uniref:CUE domain-containing protein n=1 Tax=Kuraishia capsulata CBS 1993 TaxID=1382522 RepID=W6MKC7_9ASCO|nr:uncharacterized protein KUCA_T00001074001 [Kuraishia capsulata CBS 1993]CDK25107.1 unnamed protein product [Kuraishia capsulata CBS 1993]